MTTPRPVTAPELGAPEIIRFPDPRPCDLDMTTFDYVTFQAYPAALADHLGNLDTTVIISETAAALQPTASYEGVLFPDLLISFNANPGARRARNGYLIPEQGKPPDFVLEVASASTARRDETVKREAYAAMGVREYWRFDHTGGRFHRAALAGEALVEGEYKPLAVHRTDEGDYWGHSEELNLVLCWEEGQLRFWDPVGQRYLTTDLEERAARRAAEAAREAAESARRAAEARVRQLEEELRRRP